MGLLQALYILFQWENRQFNNCNICIHDYRVRSVWLWASSTVHGFVHCYSKNVKNTVTVSTFCSDTPLTIHTQLSLTHRHTT